MRAGHWNIEVRQGDSRIRGRTVALNLAIGLICPISSVRVDQDKVLAAVAVPTAMFGVQAFMDTAHIDHNLTPRTFHSFDEEEATVSRLYAGIHYPYDNMPLGVSFIFPRCLSPPLPQWQVLHPIRKVLRRTSVSKQFQVSHTLPNGHLELMGINKPGKRYTLPLPLGCFAEQVLVLTEQDATQSRRTIKQ
jgi:hypothetical protein